MNSAGAEGGGGGGGETGRSYFMRGTVLQVYPTVSLLVLALHFIHVRRYIGRFSSMGIPPPPSLFLSLDSLLSLSQWLRRE